jgi:ribosomal protein L39E
MQIKLLILRENQANRMIPEDIMITTKKELRQHKSDSRTRLQLIHHQASPDQSLHLIIHLATTTDINQNLEI